MTSKPHARDGQIAAAIHVLEKQRSPALARHLAAALYARTSGEDLAAYGPERLARFIRSAAEALSEHRPGRSVVRISEPAAKPDPSAPAITVIEIVNDNMPFLLDSILSEMHDFGAEIRLVAHPILSVERDSAGHPSGINFETGNGKPSLVSLIQIHVAEIASEEDRRALKALILGVVKHVRAAVAGWRSMLARVEAVIADYEKNPPPIAPQSVAEAIAFLRWLGEDNFTFLGIRQYDYVGTAKSGELQRSTVPALGILSDPDVRVFGRGKEFVTTTPAQRDFLMGPEPLLVTKANAKSPVHRRAYMDYIGVKLFTPDGKLSGELRIVGLFTSTAYTRSVRAIPYIRRKIDRVVDSAGFAPDSHSGKALMNVLESYPRDELFQIEETQLARFAGEILELDERPRVRVLIRRDKFDRFVSAMVYVPRDRYTTATRIAIGDYLARTFDGHVSAYYPAFPEGLFTRVHFIIGRHEGKPAEPSRDVLEETVAALVKTWSDTLAETLAASHEPAEAKRLFALYGNAFPDAYRDDFTPKTALLDISSLEDLADDRTIAVAIYRHSDSAPSCISLKIVHRDRPIDLSVRVPMLEHFGFRVIDERTYHVDFTEGRAPAFIHDMAVETVSGQPIDLDALGEPLRRAFLAVWYGQAESDGFNALILNAARDWREVALLRGISRYLRQAGIAYSQHYMWATLNRHPDITTEIVRRFIALFTPSSGAEKTTDTYMAALERALAGVESLDEDRILRRFANIVEATVRTNYFQSFRATDENPVLTLKLDSAKVDELPKPVPFREIFVYSPRVEGVHLRFGRIARGGIRWSDRPEDFRTEVLGLVKAQQVKNAVIVPVGAKGGFVPKRLPAGPRDAIFAEGTAAYEIFISSLLDITDNLDGEKVVPPADIVRRETDDPYLVVAADKGTATFSDTANAISQRHDFWLDDAFASGGSAGYDHKAMGITARGAWEAVKRHFREIDVDIQKTPFTVAGVGDMSGDVFGNGLLLSPAARLVAAFDHRDIFLDPDPDPKTSLKERRRLFKLPRSSWQDYDRSIISSGGGIFSRKDKSIPLSRQIKALLGLSVDKMAPADLIRAILAAPVDLLFFGGIGTYIRATTETNGEIGDRANDALRVTARDIRAKVIGEGANLGMTQRARIEYGLAGGRSNSDAIDNSAGVNTSDVEVNIKIAFGHAMRSGKLDRTKRNRLLADMTDGVAALVLRNNYLQTLAISLTQARGFEDFPFQMRLMQSLEARDLLDRRIEALPDDAAMLERQMHEKPLTRPEIGVLLAYSKITLYDDLVASNVPDDAAMLPELVAYFPPEMHKLWQREIETHRLRREITATQLANAMINRGGPTFITRVADRSGGGIADIARAYVAMREAFRIEELCSAIDALDTRISGARQTELYLAVQELVLSRTVWFLRNVASSDLGAAAETYAKAVVAIDRKLGDILPEALNAEVTATAKNHVDAGIPEDLAERLARLPVLAAATDIHLVAEKAGVPPARAASVYFAVGEHFRIARIENLAHRLKITDYYDGLALDRALQHLAEAQRVITAQILAEAEGKASPFQHWMASRQGAVDRIVARVKTMTEADELTISRVTVAANLLAELAKG